MCILDNYLINFPEGNSVILMDKSLLPDTTNVLFELIAKPYTPSLCFNKGLFAIFVEPRRFAF